MPNGDFILGLFKNIACNIQYVTNCYMTRSPHFLIIIFFIWAISFSTVKAQNNSIEWKFNSSINAASSANQPFWFYSNRYGVTDPYSAGGLASLSLDIPYDKLGNSSFEYSMGTEIIGRVSEQEVFYFPELFAKLKWKNLQLKAGRFKETTGSGYHPLSMGSLSFSGNATPMPKIKIGIPEYVTFPFASWMELKGEVAHGWFEGNRYISNPWLHEKYGYIKFGGDYPLNIYGGLVHSTIWAGYRDSDSYGDLPDGIGDYFKIFFASGGAENAPSGDDYYFLGDHRGYWDFGATYSTSSFDIKAYRHFILNDKDNLKFNSPQDGLYGLALLPKSKSGFITGALYEFLYTKWQSGPEAVEAGRDNAGGWDDYYNNFIYRSGWSYHGNVIGNPLFLTYENVATDQLDPSLNNNRYIANNRIVGHHLGIEGQLTSNVNYRLLATWSRNYGTYRAKDNSQEAGVDYPFDPPLEQTSLLLETNTKLNDRFSLNVSLASDFGELYENKIGFLVGFEWNGSIGL